jgi:hypothetical protein
MSDTYNFQTELKKSIFNADEKINRKELLSDIFRCYVAKLFERTLDKEKMPFDALVKIKNNLISEFRSADLSEYQRTVEQYEELFDTTVKEILSLAAMRHKGIDNVNRAPQNLEINPEIYIHEGGLVKPVSSL